MKILFQYKVKKILTIPIFLFLYCILSAQNFKIRQFHFSADTSIESVTLLNDRFYCLTSDSILFIIDTLNNKKIITKLNKSGIRLLSLNDSLFAQTRFGDSLFWFNGSYLLFIRKLKNDIPFFEDDDFIVTKSCSGEWGGSVYFDDKKNKKKYECEATCPVIVNKINRKYLITASLAHLEGSTEVLEINDPTLLLEYNRDNLKGKKVIYVGEAESHSTKGTKKLVDSVGVFTTTSFIYENKDYYIVTNFKKTYLCYIKDKVFVPIAKISDKSFWSYQTFNYTNQTSGLISVFTNYDTSGFLWIKGNQITSYTFDHKL